MSFSGFADPQSPRAKLLTVVGCALTFGIGFSLAFAIPAHAAGGKFDGRWSIEVITEQGTCDKAYRYAVNILDGEPKYAGREEIVVRGRIGGDGHINGSIAYQDNKADVMGALQASGTGVGTWKYDGKSSSCTGRWNAERRG